MLRSEFLLPRTARSLFVIVYCLLVACAVSVTAEDGIYIRFKLQDAKNSNYSVKLGGYIHNDPWCLPEKVYPDGGGSIGTNPPATTSQVYFTRKLDKRGSISRLPAKVSAGSSTRGRPVPPRQPARPIRRPIAVNGTPAPVSPQPTASTPSLLATGVFSPWIDLKAFYGNLLHPRLYRSGGYAEFPNLTINFVVNNEPEGHREVTIELATAADENSIVKTLDEKFVGTLTSVLVSPTLKADKDSLETASQMALRHLKWAQQATATGTISPKELILETRLWAPQRPQLNFAEAAVLRKLGFNMVGQQPPEVTKRNYFKDSFQTFDVTVTPDTTRDMATQQIKNLVPAARQQLASGSLLHFRDEVTAPRFENSSPARATFITWLKNKGVAPTDLGLTSLDNIPLLDTPDQLKAELLNNSKANRIFWYCCRFRQEATSERFRWLTEEAHKQIRNDLITSTLIPDHPYFGGVGMGMGMKADHTWENFSLSVDWFELARTKALDMVGIEDWMGLQYMFGPNATWEGFQLMGYQAAIIRSGGRGEVPCMTWITPSDETNLRLKSGSAMAQGSKHMFFWTFGPTATSTENYWSDIRSAYDGVAHLAKQMAQSEHIISPGKTRPTKVAILYGISSDIWQPFEYIHMLDRRGLYFSLVHDHYLVDFIPEEDVIAGRLKDYDVLYTADPCLQEAAIAKIREWVFDGGCLFGSSAAGTRNQYNEAITGLAPVFGIKPNPTVTTQAGSYWIRGALNSIPYTDQMTGHFSNGESIKLGVIGAKVAMERDVASVLATFNDGKPAVTSANYGRGKALCFGGCPGISYIKEALFVPEKLAEQWPDWIRAIINQSAVSSGAQPLVQLSHPVVETGIYDAPKGTALVLANFTYQPIKLLQVRIATPKTVSKVTSIESGNINFQSTTLLPTEPTGWSAVKFTMTLGINDIVLLE